MGCGSSRDEVMLDACKTGDLRSAAAVLKMGFKPNTPMNVRPLRACVLRLRLRRRAAPCACACGRSGVSPGLAGCSADAPPPPAAQSLGDTPLLLAVRFGRLELALLLLQSGAKAGKANKARARRPSRCARAARLAARPGRRIARPAARRRRQASVPARSRVAGYAGWRDGAA